MAACWSPARRRRPTLPIGRVVRTSKTQGYWRIHDRTRLPSLAATDLLFVDGDYVELAPVDPPVLTLIPTAMFGPPEKVWSDKTETTVPGLVVAPHGKGRAAYIPWDVGGLYYRHSSPAHAALVTDVIDQLLPDGRQLRTSAHPLVEMTLMTQPARGRTLVHLVNGSGHHDTAYFAPIAMRDIRVELPGMVRRVRAVALGRDLPVTARDGWSAVTLPSLDAYEVLEIESRLENDSGVDADDSGVVCPSCATTWPSWPRTRRGLVAAFALARELDLVARDGALVEDLHVVALEVGDDGERDGVTLDRAVGDRHVAVAARRRAGQLLAFHLEVEGLSRASGRRGRGPARSTCR